MATKRMLPDTVTVFNYMGEFNDVAKWQKTVIEHCYCPVTIGANENMQGHVKGDSARLYIFDANSVAMSEHGQKRTFLPFDEWKYLDDKTPYWTISDKGTDYFYKDGCPVKFKIKRFAHKVAGTRRMWHFEVDGS